MGEPIAGQRRVDRRRVPPDAADLPGRNAAQPRQALARRHGACVAAPRRRQGHGGRRGRHQVPVQVAEAVPPGRAWLQDEQGLPAAGLRLREELPGGDPDHGTSHAASQGARHASVAGVQGGPFEALRSQPPAAAHEPHLQPRGVQGVHRVRVQGGDQQAEAVLLLPVLLPDPRRPPRRLRVPHPGGPAPPARLPQIRIALGAETSGLGAPRRGCCLWHILLKDCGVCGGGRL
mmetsp:Transcript_697/g.1706  ORF Transcript_697/g.1706 Transcript_697/m.1706 type:complete len:233 (+) Transcript_697:1187-1885(+)